MKMVKGPIDSADGYPTARLEPKAKAPSQRQRILRGRAESWTVPSSPVAFMLPCARYQVAGHGGGICA